MVGAADLVSDPGWVGGQSIPAVVAEARFTERAARGGALVAEPGAPTRVRFEARAAGANGPPSFVTLSAETRVVDLGRVRRLGVEGDGQASLRLDAEVDLAAKRVRATVHGGASDVRVGEIALGGLVLSARAQGPFDAPRVVVDTKGVALRAAGYEFSRIEGRAVGSPENLDVAAALVSGARSPSATLATRVAVGPGVALRGTKIELARDDVGAAVNVAAVEIEGGAVDVRGLTIEGLGERVTADATLRGGAVTVRARSSRVDLARVAKLVAREEDLRGSLALDVDVTTDGRTARGRVVALVDGQKLRGELEASLAGVGRVEVDAPDVRLAGSLASPRSWLRATGTAQAEGEVNLAAALERVPKEMRPVASASGRVVLLTSASRSDADAIPDVDLDVHTDELALVGRADLVRHSDGTISLAPPPWKTSGVDGGLRAKVEGESGRAGSGQKLAIVSKNHFGISVSSVSARQTRSAGAWIVRSTTMKL